MLLLLLEPQQALATTHVQTLGLQSNTEFPQKSCFLVEALVEQGDAAQFLEITGGLLTNQQITDQVKQDLEKVACAF